MHYPHLVDFFDAVQDLMEELDRLLLFNTALSYDVIEQLPTRSELHYQVKLLRCLYDLVQLDYVRMADQLQNVDLARHALHVGGVHDALFLEDLHRDLFASEDVRSQLHLAERALANCLAQNVVADGSFGVFLKIGCICVGLGLALTLLSVSFWSLFFLILLFPLVLLLSLGHGRCFGFKLLGFWIYNSCHCERKIMELIWYVFYCVNLLQIFIMLI